MSAVPRRAVAVWAPWAALVVVLGVALGVGASHGTPLPTGAQRVQAIDALVRCPSCDGISVGDSSASTAVAIRQAVTARVRAGQSDAQIDAFLVSRYGPGILLRPPVRGWTAWVWVLPPVALVAAGVALATVLWRRRRRQGAAVPAPVSPEDRALVQQALVTRSGADAARTEPGRTEPGRTEPGRTEVVRAP